MPVFLRNALLIVALVLAGPALAHPHVWITAKAELLFGEGGKVAAVRHAWTFDPAYSAYAVQGLDKNGDGKTSPEELGELAAFMTESVKEFGFFTALKAGGTAQEFGAPRAERLAFEGGALTLSFELPLKIPAPGRLVVLEVADRTFFVQFQTAEGADAVTLAGAPTGCTVTVSRPKPSTVDTSKLSESFFESLSAAATFSTQLANRAMVACP